MLKNYMTVVRHARNNIVIAITICSFLIIVPICSPKAAKLRGTALHEAAKEGDIANAVLLLKYGADINALDECRRTPLYFAIDNNRMPMVKFLLKKGADVNPPLSVVVPSTPLHLAIAKKDPKLVEMLLEKNAMVDREDRDSFTPIESAIIGLQHNDYNFDIIRLLISKKPNLNKISKKFGVTPLIRCLMWGITSQFYDMSGVSYRDKLHRKIGFNVAKYLIEKGCDITIADKNNQAPLHHAVFCALDPTKSSISKTEFNNFFEMLISRGANINTKSSTGYTPMMIAIANNRKDIADTLSEIVKNYPPARPLINTYPNKKRNKEVLHDKIYTLDLKDNHGIVKTERIHAVAWLDRVKSTFHFEFYTKAFDRKDWAGDKREALPVHVRHTVIAPQYMGIIILHPENVEIGESTQKGFLIRDSIFSRKYGWEELLPYKDHKNAQIAMDLGENVIDILLSKIPFGKDGYKLLLEYYTQKNEEYYNNIANSIVKGKERFVATMIPLHIPKDIIGYTETARSIEIPFGLRIAEGEQKMSFWINPAFGNPSDAYSQGDYPTGFARIEGINIDFDLTGKKYEWKPAKEKKDIKMKLGLNVSYMKSYLCEIVNNQKESKYLDSKVVIDIINERLKKINNICYGLYSLRENPNRFRLQVTGGIKTPELSELFSDYKKIRFRFIQDITAKGKIGFLFKNGGVFIRLRFSKWLSPNGLRNKLSISEDSIIQQANSAANPTDIYLWLSFSDLSESDYSHKGIADFISNKLEGTGHRYHIGNIELIKSRHNVNPIVQY